VFNSEYYLTSSLATLRTGKLLRTDSYLAYNGVVQNDDSLKQSGNNYGFNLNQNKLVFNDYYGSLGKFLSNAPIGCEARLTDYGTLSFFNFLNVSENSFQVGTDNATINMVNYITITLYNSAGVQLGSVINVNTSI
jgi:hypothetical protein